MFDAAPDEWRKGSLGDLIQEPAERIDPGQADGTSGHYVGLEHIGQGTGRISSVGRVADVVSQKTIFQPGDILYGKLRPNLRKVARPDFGGICSTDIVVFRANKGADPDFAFQLLQSEPLVSHAVSTAAGTKMPRTHARSILSFGVALPPLNEQRRIAEVLGSLDDYISSTTATFEAVHTTKNATLTAAMSDKWAETTVGELLASTQYPMRSGPFGSALLKSELKPNGIPFLGIDNVQIERFVPNYKRFISRQKYNELARYTVYPDDVMVTIMGTVGRCCVVPRNVETAISSKHVWTLSLDKNRYSPALLAWQINHAPWVLDQLRGSSQGGIMSAISSGTLRELSVPLPPERELRELEEMLLAFNATLAELEVNLASAKTLKAAVVDDLLTGRVRVPV